MKLLMAVLSCVAMVLVVTACTETAAPTNTSTPRAAGSPASASPAASVDQFARAEANYKKHCDACHGESGEGGLVKVDNKQIKVASLKSEHAMKHTDEKLQKTITGGDEEMPAFKDKMSQEEIAEMVQFVRKHFQGK